MAVVFHRLIMPDGYSVDLDQFSGLNQIGEMGLKDKVDNHYVEIFGTPIALGVIAGAAEMTQGGSSINSNGSQMLVNGVSILDFRHVWHNSWPVHADSADHHDSARAQGQGVFHTRYAAPGIFKSPINQAF